MAKKKGTLERARERTQIIQQQLQQSQQKQQLQQPAVIGELLKEVEFFDSNVTGKLKKYEGKYVAIKNCAVITEGDSYGEVSEKVRKSKYRSEKCVLIRKVTKEQPIHFVPFPLS